MEASIGTPRKSSPATKWLIGCGLGCGVVIIIIIILATGGYFFVKNLVEGFEETEATMETLIERYGEIRDFCPDPDGAIKSERIEAFLAVRSSLDPVKEKLQDSIDILSDEKRKDESKEEASPGVLSKIKTGFGLIPLFSEFINIRNQALLDNEMGIGEYIFIYVVAYYSWLGKSPADGLQHGFFQREEDRGRFAWDEEDTLEDRLDRLLKRLHKLTLPMLKNQHTKVTESDGYRVNESWLTALKAEIEAMEADRFRLPWQDGLPDALNKSLQPFRERLETTYSQVLNPLEMTMEQR